MSAPINKRRLDWNDYPLGTKVFAVNGGYWTKTERGWQWCTGATFPTPGGDWSRIEMPAAIGESTQ